MNTDQLKRANEISDYVKSLSDMKKTIIGAIDYAAPSKDEGVTIRVPLKVSYVPIVLPRQDYINGMKLVLMKYEKEISDLENEFNEL